MPIMPDLHSFHASQRAYERGKAEGAAEIRRLREALEFVKSDLENCDWTCKQCFRDYGMTDTDIYLWVRDALAPQTPPLAIVNEVR